VITNHGSDIMALLASPSALSQDEAVEAEKWAVGAIDPALL
jgi:hypothetical protein